MSYLIDLTGQRFGKWRVLRQAGNYKGGDSRSREARWECECACGAVRFVRGGPLRNGRSLSCGCHRPGKWSKLLPKIERLRAKGLLYKEIAPLIGYPGHPDHLAAHVAHLKAWREGAAEQKKKLRARAAQHSAKVLVVQQDTRLGASAAEIAEARGLNERVVVRMRSEAPRLELDEPTFKRVRTMRFDQEMSWAVILRETALPYASPRALEAAWNCTADVLGGLLADS